MEQQQKFTVHSLSTHYKNLTMSSSQQRRVTGYLKPRINTMFKTYVKANETTESEAINDIMRHFFTTAQPAQMNVWIRKAQDKQRIVTHSNK